MLNSCSFSLFQKRLEKSTVQCVNEKTLRCGYMEQIKIKQVLQWSIKVVDLVCKGKIYILVNNL